MSHGNDTLGTNQPKMGSKLKSKAWVSKFRIFPPPFTSQSDGVEAN